MWNDNCDKINEINTDSNIDKNAYVKNIHNDKGRKHNNDT